MCTRCSLRAYPRSNRQIQSKIWLAYQNDQNSAANRVFFVSVSRYASSKYAIFATNFDHLTIPMIMSALPALRVQNTVT
ncbi:MAG: hypothetical protein G01um101448_860 [Parcubacteria group bacterium Gr01-1014_48]|nr:MAG: hypothetical protein G01um101448_860 [Parcubacteria group bacterium Gr01-1014_48]